MRMSDAKAVIEGKTRREGYAVSFEVWERGMLRSDHFPDLHGGESGIPTEEEAWALAASFAHAKQRDEVVNVYVIRAADFSPVEGYRSRMLKAH
jgi:hypothetical protein